VSYRRPAIESIAVDGDLAAVRLIWTVTITAADGTVLENAREKGLDVLRRRADGRWRISLSYAFPLA
jgi:ketosteroid isomerase-like protein